MTTIWFDLTTSERMGGFSRVGITRVESQYASWFLAHKANCVRFCHIGRRSGRFHALSHEAASQLIAGVDRGDLAGPAHQRSRLRLWISQPERWLRHARRRVTRWLCDWSPTFRNYLDLAPFQPGDVLLLLGCTWGWYDLAWLVRLKAQVGMRLVFLCFDLIPAKFPHLFPPAAVPPYMRFLELMLVHADLIVCISEATNRDLRECAAARGRALPATCVVPLGHDLPDLSDAPSKLRAASLTPGGFVLCVGTLEIRKNHALLHQVWRRLVEERGKDVPTLVLVGSIGWHIEKLIYIIKHDVVVASHIAIISGARDADLAWLYRNCLFTVYPSLYEGFGLPIAESLAYGKHCIASSTSAMPEAGAGLARHLDPLDVPAWLAEIESLLDDPNRLKTIEAHIKATYRPVSWETSGHLLYDALSCFASGNGNKAAA